MAQGRALPLQAALVASGASGGSLRSYASVGTSSTTASAGAPKVVVFGGRGFVGSNICKEAASHGLSVLGVSRGGTPPICRDSWVDSVSWVRGNALEPQSFVEHLEGASAVISCVGGFGSQQEQLRTNGAANVSLIEAARAAGVPRFVFISAAPFNIPGIEMLLGGYIRGKAAAEEALRTHFPTSGVALRPGVIYGDRDVSTNVTLPLGLFFKPYSQLVEKVPNAKSLSELPLVGAALVPPVSVTTVARAAVRAATDPSVPAGVIDVWALADEDH
ncbi:hypothetical protein HYH03_004286 [Edaphochlamys debaryana]|uniref:NAD-dependent epimerase/dehydratase domain-containing protein n=1 Tax=Edaphochlamys debaryana TaxID=47281 RepID=A0A835YH56_9CHLO|nr:hypothetical protein HYH03_004286 [Edaphochlamys debaryana]|eukprot:KAG2497539.1 hypothetical protein HYH03_004286 [Edaphochlamys debaryana]